MRTNEEFMPKSLGTGAGMATVLTTAFGGIAGLNTALATASIATLAPLIGGAIIGTLLFAYPTVVLQGRIDKRFDVREATMTNRCCHFMLQAASMTLSVLVGLAIMSAFMTIIANPFTLPALIAGGISAAIVLGVYVATYPRHAQAENMEEEEPVMQPMIPARYPLYGTYQVLPQTNTVVPEEKDACRL